MSSAAAPPRILFIGNSLTYWRGGLDGLFRSWGFDASAETIPGATLAKVWKAGRARQRIEADGPWDFVVLQDDLPEYVANPGDGRSRAEIVTQRFCAVAELAIDAVLAVNATPIFFMAHPYARLPTTLDDIIAAHRALHNSAHERGVAVAPGAIAHRTADVRAAALAESLPLLDPDEEHESEAGLLLHAATIAITMIGARACWLIPRFEPLWRRAAERPPPGMSEEAHGLLISAAHAAVVEWRELAEAAADAGAGGGGEGPPPGPGWFSSTADDQRAGLRRTPQQEVKPEASEAHVELPAGDLYSSGA